MNLGAKQETDSGIFFSWGNTDGYAGDSGHDFGSVNDFDDQSQTWVGVYGETAGGQLTNSFTPGGDYDAATAMLKTPWKTPTRANFDELMNTEYCTRSWVQNFQGSGKNGLLFTSVANGKTVFFPAAGYVDGSTLKDAGNYGSYWSATLGTVKNAYEFNFRSNESSIHYSGRYYGYSVRAVRYR